jgi:phosphatidylinositol alpha-mannosyltransferase
LLHELSHWLAARGHAVTVISTEPGDRRVESDGPVRRVLLSQRDPLAVRGRGCNFFHRFGWQLRRVLCEDDYDAVHCLNYHDAGGALLARRRGARSSINSSESQCDVTSGAFRSMGCCSGRYCDTPM